MLIENMTDITLKPPYKITAIDLFDKGVIVTRKVGIGVWMEVPDLKTIAERNKDYRAITEASFNRLLRVLMNLNSKNWCRVTITRYENNLTVFAEK